MKKIKAVILIAVFSALIFSVPLSYIFTPYKEYSLSERRVLAAFPGITYEKILDGSFMEEFEKFTQDQFPLRETLRSLKAGISYKLLGKKDNNGLYMADGHISKLDSTLNPNMLDYASEKFKFLYESFIKDKNAKVYLSVVPDKNMFLAEKNGYPAFQYEKLTEYMKEENSYMEYIDIFPFLSADDYYTTDSHWKQESITDVAEYIGEKMGADVKAEYEINSLDFPFYGVYHGQIALKGIPADEIKYLTNDTLSSATVTYYDTGMPETGDMYNMEKAKGKDPYEMFLSGTTPLAVMENNEAEKRELVIFRDSFGGSLAPLLLEGYSKITLVDIRYVQSQMVGNLVDFENADVLFLYSTSLLNNSLAMK